jgi:hypothetical protein
MPCHHNAYHTDIQRYFIVAVGLLFKKIAMILAGIKGVQCAEPAVVVD